MQSIELNKDYIFNPVKFSNLCVNISNDWQNKIIKDTFSILGEDFRLWNVADIKFYAVLRSSVFNGKPTNMFHLSLKVNHVLFQAIAYSLEVDIPLVRDIDVRERISKAFYSYFLEHDSSDIQALNYSVLIIDRIKAIKNIINALSMLFEDENEILNKINQYTLWNGRMVNLHDVKFYHFYIEFGINRESVPHLTFISKDIKISFMPHEMNIIHSNTTTDSLLTKTYNCLLKDNKDTDLVNIIKNHIINCFNKIYDTDFNDVKDLFNVLDMENY
jgi:hypothetical protein